MANDTDDVRDEMPEADETKALGEVRSALEAVERQQGDVLRERRRLRAQLDALLSALREDAAVLLFDADGDLTEAKGPIEEQLGVSADELVSSLESLVDEETVDALDEANRTVLDPDSSGVSLSDGFVRSHGEEIAVTFIHRRRSDDDREPAGVEVIGLVAPAANGDEGADDVDDSVDDSFEQIFRRLLDDAGERSVERTVETLGGLLGADRVVVNRYDEDRRKFSVMSSWLRGDTLPLDAEDRGISISQLPWAYSALGAGEAVVISDDVELPADAGPEKDLYGGDDVKSSLLVPMVRGDHLDGFVSIQSVREERAWTKQDMARARRFAAVLTLALARSEAESALAEAREEAEQAASRSSDAEARIAELEESEADAREKLDKLSEEAEVLRSRVEQLEREVEAARRDEREAQDAAEEASNELDSARKRADEAERELAELHKDSDDGGAEVESLREQVERAQRRSEEAAADALSVREELDDVRRQLEEARSEAARLRVASDRGAKPVDLDDEGTPELDQREEAQAGRARDREDGPAAASGFDPETTVEMKRDDIGFDPDATIEMESMSWQPEGSEANGVDDAGDARGTADDGLDDGRTAGDDVDEMPEHAQAEAEDERETSEWKADKVSWEDSTGEVDLPEFLGADVARDKERTSDEARDEGVDDDLEAARDVAREVAGKDDDFAWDLDRDEDQTDDDFDTWRDDSPSGTDALADLDLEAERPELADRVERTGELDAYDTGRDDAVREREAELPELRGIDTEVGLADVGGNVELYRNLLTKFRKDYIGAGAKIGSAIEKGNIEVAHLLLHAVKGVAGVLGAARVRDAADELETRLIGDDSEATDEAVEEFTGALDEVLDSIGRLEAEPEGASGGGSEEEDGSAEHAEAHVSDPMVLRSYLSGLRQHLLAEKPRQCMLVMREITARNWPGDYNDRVARLASLIDDGDFEEARDVFEELMGQFVES